jgi:hypothetical protein
MIDERELMSGARRFVDVLDRWDNCMRVLGQKSKLWLVESRASFAVQ